MKIDVDRPAFQPPHRLDATQWGHFLQDAGTVHGDRSIHLLMEVTRYRSTT